MSQITASKPHGMTKAEALIKLAGLASHCASKYGVKIDLDGDVATVNGKGVTGTARVDETHVRLNLKLGLAARLISGKIQAGVDKALLEHFAG
jgi:putative polyhydroxyalkanoate system protein